jgi:hypothetical protein
MNSSSVPSQHNGETDPAIRQGWLRTFLFLVSAFILSLAGQLAALFTVIAVSGVELDQSFDQSRIIEVLGIWPVVLIMLTGFAGMMLSLWIFRRFVDRRSIASLGFSTKNKGMDALIGFSLGLVLIGGGFFILWLGGFVQVEKFRFDPGILAGYFLLFVIGSLNEEIMFRGYIVTNLRDSMSRYTALIISSVIFALAHLANANISVISALNIFLAGVLLGIYYIYRGNLWLPITLHFSWNFFQGPVFGFEVSGSITYSMIVQNISGHPLITGEPFGFEGSLPATVLILIGILGLHYRYRNGVRP